MCPMSRTPEDIQDELLILQWQAGDAKALKELIDRWQPRLVRFVWLLTGQREAARDVVQDVWLAVVRGLRRLDDPARFRSWAYRIARNKCADWTRRRTAGRRADEALGHEIRTARSADAGEKQADADETDRLQEALAKLADEQKAVLSLHYLDGMGLAEIARVLDVPVGTVKSRLYHARERLKQALERVR